MLEYTSYISQKTQTPKSMVLMLHGYGSNKHDLITLAPDLESVLEAPIFYSVDGPFQFEGGVLGARQWYSLMDRSTNAMLEGFKRAKPFLDEFIAKKLSEHNLSHSDITIMGFSQGGMMSLHYGLQMTNQPKGIMSFSGFILDDGNFMNSVQNRAPVFLSHGDLDLVVPFAAYEYAKTLLQEAGIEVSGYVAQGLGHGIDFGCLEHAQQFLKR